MGYACPVCGTPQADGEHLAHHLAITAMTHGADHEDWLDEHAADWGDCGPDELAEQVIEYADEVEHETVFEDTTDDSGRRFEDELRRQVGDAGRGDLTGSGGRGRAGGRADETEAVLEEARALTERMLDDTAADGSPDNDERNSDDTDGSDASS